jgi:hypothetical protein
LTVRIYYRVFNDILYFCPQNSRSSVKNNPLVDLDTVYDELGENIEIKVGFAGEVCSDDVPPFLISDDDVTKAVAVPKKAVEDDFDWAEHNAKYNPYVEDIPKKTLKINIASPEDEASFCSLLATMNYTIVKGVYCKDI